LTSASISFNKSLTAEVRVEVVTPNMSLQSQNRRVLNLSGTPGNDIFPRGDDFNLVLEKQFENFPFWNKRKHLVACV
jgi:hypothetical protein